MGCLDTGILAAASLQMGHIKAVREAFGFSNASVIR